MKVIYGIQEVHKILLLLLAQRLAKELFEGVAGACGLSHCRDEHRMGSAGNLRRRAGNSPIEPPGVLRELRPAQPLNRTLETL